MSLLPEFEYKRPESLEEFLHLLSDYKGDTMILAGGTDLLPRIKMGLKNLDLIIDIKDIEGLSYVKDEGENVRIGALTIIYEIIKSKIIKDKYPALHEAATLTASENLQQRGTIGGNILQDTRCLYYNKPETWRKSFNPCFKTGGEICNAARGGKKCFAVYCGDLAPALISLGASVCLLGKKGEKEMPLEDVFSGDGRSPFSLSSDELVKDIIIPSDKMRGGYEKLRMRKSIDYPVVNIALSMDAGHKGRLVVGSAGANPLIYDFSSSEELRQIPEKAQNDMSTVNNMYLSPLYRKNMVRVLADKLLKRV
ncbi:MAG: FAD binding domain-containing protein [Proteobacteria bacterium]|nr:FAD binding domain-containing protein [Pseudomonadota bacterium]